MYNTLRDLAVAWCLLAVVGTPAAAQEPPDLDAGSAADAGLPEASDMGPDVGADASSASASVTPPVLIERVDAVYPPDALAARREGTTILQITIGTDGAVYDVGVVESAGPEFDRAAMSAILAWKFAPARRGDVPIESRIRVPFAFTLPAEPPPAVATAPPDKTVPEPAQPPTTEPTPVAKKSAEDEVIDVTVQGKRELRSQDRSAGDFTIGRQVVQAAPHAEGADALKTAPGLYMSRAEGIAVAHRYMLRGFDADHGQDLELRVGGLPINLPSQIHGQGYADLGFLIGEAVDGIQVSEGVYDPHQGDFAVAGTIATNLGVEKRGITARSGYGAFDTLHQVLVWAPPGEDRGTFGAVQYQSSDGFGQNRDGKSASAILQAVLGTGAWRFRALGIVYGARSNLAGVVRDDDVADGTVGFYDVYPFPTAEGQNALSGRILAGTFGEYRGANGDNAQLSAWLGVDDFRLQENFTGFIQRSQTLANVTGRGDLIEQRNRTRSMGLGGWYRTAPYRPAKAIHGTAEVGFEGRVDDIVQAQNLLNAAVRNETWDRRVDANVFGAELGFWADLDWHLTRYLQLRFGPRADVLYYDVDDRLGNFAPAIRPQDTYIVGYRRSAFGVAWGPRTSAEVRPLDWLAFRAAYGEGYRSPQARVLEDGQAAPYSKVRSADLGVRFGSADTYELSLGGYFTRLSDDIAFEAEEGRLERIGATRRLGAVLHAEAHPKSWLVGAASVTYVDAELLEPPPPTADEPVAPFQAGQNLPFVPPVVVRVDLGARPTIVSDLARHPLIGHAGLGFSYLSARPLPYGDFADPVPLFDASLGAEWGPVTLDASVFNLLNTRYAASEFTFPSDWDPEAPRTRTPARHIAAGAPFTWMINLGITL